MGKFIIKLLNKRQNTDHNRKSENDFLRCKTFKRKLPTKRTYRKRLIIHNRPNRNPGLSFSTLNHSNTNGGMKILVQNGDYLISLMLTFVVNHQDLFVEENTAARV